MFSLAEKGTVQPKGGISLPIRGQRVPLDGVVVEGTSALDTAALTAAGRLKRPISKNGDVKQYLNRMVM